MALEAKVGQPQVDRIILEQCPEGVYVLVYVLGDTHPSQDYLQDSWELAKQHALEDYGVTGNQWVEIPDTGIMS